MDQVRSGLTLVTSPVLSILREQEIGGLCFRLVHKMFIMADIYSKIFGGGKYSLLTILNVCMIYKTK